MAIYFLTYDLRNTRNYQILYDELNNYNAPSWSTLWYFVVKTEKYNHEGFTKDVTKVHEG